MSHDEEIADIENRLFGMSHGHIEYPVLNQRLIALRLAKQEMRNKNSYKATQPPVKKYYEKPYGIIALGIIASLIATAIWFIGSHVIT